jgi:DNA-binding NarL/FixJ family response regulator
VPRVYLVFCNQIFSDAICAILETHPEIELVGTTNERDRVAADVAALNPHVILVEETEDGSAIDDAHFILTSPKPYRLITLRLDADEMHVWSQIWREAVSTDDLVEAIVTAGEDEL